MLIYQEFVIKDGCDITEGKIFFFLDFIISEYLLWLSLLFIVKTTDGNNGI